MWTLNGRVMLSHLRGLICWIYLWVKYWYYLSVIIWPSGAHSEIPQNQRLVCVSMCRVINIFPSFWVIKSNGFSSHLFLSQQLNTNSGVTLLCLWFNLTVWPGMCHFHQKLSPKHLKRNWNATPTCCDLFHVEPTVVGGWLNTPRFVFWTDGVDQKFE